ncbi:hypothetical protein [Pseudoduganella sp.]|uniref:hypothetical protein n=1 Tax=Pseudoduganella sp. TaxID=1880898 RepID=UPI0035B02C07
MNNLASIFAAISQGLGVAIKVRSVETSAPAKLPTLSTSELNGDPEEEKLAK